VKENFITVTEAARNFADCVNRAHYQNVTFVLLKNGHPVARLVPNNDPDNEPESVRVCSGRDLARVLAQAELSDKAAKAWHRDLQAARKKLKPPAGKW
jgi:antitoxin (DNA-binding transcriptional repressor) of toxin-antitoxin stability system